MHGTQDICKLAYVSLPAAPWLGPTDHSTKSHSTEVPSFFAELERLHVHPELQLSIEFRELADAPFVVLIDLRLWLLKDGLAGVVAIDTTRHWRNSVWSEVETLVAQASNPSLGEMSKQLENANRSPMDTYPSVGRFSSDHKVTLHTKGSSARFSDFERHKSMEPPRTVSPPPSSHHQPYPQPRPATDIVGLRTWKEAPNPKPPSDDSTQRNGTWNNKDDEL